MAIQQTKKQSDLEKRLRLLRQQVYGKSSEHSENKGPDSVGIDSQHIRTSENLIHRYTDTLIHRPTDTLTTSDITYLYQDLLKISLLAGLALGAQIILFYLSKSHILNLNFF